MSQPIYATTDFDNLAPGTIIEGDATVPGGLVATNVDGWDFALLSQVGADATLGIGTVGGGTNLFVGQVFYETAFIDTLIVKPDDDSTFTLNSIDITIAGGSTYVTIQGYRNGVPVDGATATLFVGDANDNNVPVTFGVSANSLFAGLDSFRIVLDPDTVIGGLPVLVGVDNIRLNLPGPVLTLSGGTSEFAAGNSVPATPVPVDPGLILADPASPTLASATVTITGNLHPGEDVLAFTNTGAYGNIAGSYNATTGTLTLTSSGATATLAQWQAALRAVTYADTSRTPNTAPRRISFAVDDGVNTSAVATHTVTLAASITPQTIDIYRFFDSATGTHLFTTSLDEKNAIVDPNSPGYKPGFVAETNGFKAFDPASNDPDRIAVYRFFDQATGAHFMTSSASERDGIMNPASANYHANYNYEPNATFYEHATQQAGDVAVYRLFDANDGTHFYTSDAAEIAGITTAGAATYRPNMIAEGIAFYAPSGSLT